MLSIKDEDKERFWRNTSIKGANDCWIWSNGNAKTYGTFFAQGKTFISSRFAYFLEYGSIPDNHVVRHTCNNPACVNPKHLVTGTQLENMRDPRTPIRERKSNISVRIEICENDHKRIRVLAAESGTSVRAYVTSLILKIIDEHSKE